MSTPNPAAQAIIEALKDPGLTPEQRAGLVAALQALMPSAPSQAPAPAPHSPTVTSPMKGRRMELTKSGVAAIPLPLRGEVLIFDTTCPQLAVRARPGGRTYIVMTWDRERRRRASKTLGKCAALTPEQARVRAQQVVADVSAGQDIRRASDTGLTLRELVKRWHAEKSKGRRTADELRDKALDWLGKLADRPAAEIEREDIGRIHHDIATKARKRVYKRIGDEVLPVEVGEPGMPATADKWRATVAAVYTWGVGKGLVATNPASGIAQAFDTKRAARTHYLKGDELLKFWAAMEADLDVDTRDVFKLLLFTGQRRGNVLEMRWSDVDLAAGRWSLSAGQTKQGRAQTTPLVTQAREILQRRQADAGTPWVFPAVRRGKDGEVGPMSEARLRDAWLRITKAAGIKGMRIHDLRHTSGSWLARLGASEAIRQKALGHQTPAMAARYAHLELDPVADALQRVADAVQAAATKPAATVRKFKRGVA